MTADMADDVVDDMADDVVDDMVYINDMDYTCHKNKCG